LLVPPELKFAELSDHDAMHRWQTRPARTYRGFDAKKYGFTKVAFSSWHTRVREGNGRLINDSTEGLMLGIQTIGPAGKHWYEVVQPQGLEGLPGNELLYIQLKKDLYATEENGTNTEEALGTNAAFTAKTATDEMDQWLELDLATPDPALPIFSLSYSYNESGANAFGVFENNLLVDLRGGAPRFLAAAQCKLAWDGGGACTGADTSAWTEDSTSCMWEAPASDFHCITSSAYSGEFNPRRAEHDFYLSTRKPARPKWLANDTPADVGELALRLRKASMPPKDPTLLLGLGSTALIARWPDLLPNAEVFLFGSLGAGESLNGHFSLVVVPGGDKPIVTAVPKWSISGEETDEDEGPAGYTPVHESLGFKTQRIETRPGFEAVAVVLSWKPSEPVHVLYWVGVEAVNGDLVANGVRLASEATLYVHCGGEMHDGTATAVQQKPGFAEATVHVQPKELTSGIGLEDDQKPSCSWTGLLRWKPGIGFRVQKTAQNCKASGATVIISNEGRVSVRPTPRP